MMLIESVIIALQMNNDPRLEWWKNQNYLIKTLQYDKVFENLLANQHDIDFTQQCEVICTSIAKQKYPQIVTNPSRTIINME